MFGLFKKKPKKPRQNRPINYVCDACGHDCSKCDTPFCYACYTGSGVCPSCGNDTVKKTPLAKKTG